VPYRLDLDWLLDWCSDQLLYALKNVAFRTASAVDAGLPRLFRVL
jgi:hypothetical protein